MVTATDVRTELEEDEGVTMDRFLYDFVFRI